MFLRLRIPPTSVGVIANLLLNNDNCTAATVIMNLWQIEDPAKTLFMLGVATSDHVWAFCVFPSVLKSQALLDIRIVSFKLSPVDCHIFILCLVMSSYSVSNVIILSVVYIHTVLCECVELKEQLQVLHCEKHFG